MLKEIFKKQAIITKVDQDGIDFEVRLAMHHKDLKNDAIAQVIRPKIEYTFTDKDKLFFMPGCTVPRFKVKQLCEKTGMSVTKTPDSCTVAISGIDTPKNIVSEITDWNSFTKDQVLEYIDNNYPMAFAGVLKLKSFLEKEDSLDIICTADYHVSSYMKTVNKDKSGFPKVSAGETQRAHLWVTEEKRIADFDKIFDNETTIIFQDDLLTMLNSGNIMDEEMYRETKKMFDSEDTNNHVLAMELMANCDYAKSCIYLLLLFKDHSTEIRNRKEKDHVNFKALTSFFGIRIDRYLDLDGIVSLLTKKNLLSKSDLPILLKLAHEEFTDNLNSDYFRSGHVEANDDLLNALEKADQIRANRAAGIVEPEEEQQNEDDEDDDY